MAARCIGPRVASHSHSPDSGDTAQLVEKGRIHDHVQINPKLTLNLSAAQCWPTRESEAVADGVTKAELGGTAYKYFHHDGQSPLSAWEISASRARQEQPR